jgi:hypothetical protein
MTNEKGQIAVRCPDFLLLFVIGHLTENPCQAAKNFHVSSTRILSAIIAWEDVLAKKCA